MGPLDVCLCSGGATRSVAACGAAATEYAGWVDWGRGAARSAGRGLGCKQVNPICFG
jgi:hypothetical protein